MIWRLRLGALGLTAGGLLWAVPVAISLAGGEFPAKAYIAGVLLAGLSLPLAVHRPSLRPRALGVAGWLLGVAGVVLVVLFNMRLVLVVADSAGILVWDSTIGTGRKAVLLVTGAGLVALAVAWSRAPDDVPVRLALLAVGGAGVALAFASEGRVYATWYVALGALWFYVGLVSMLDARREART